MPNICHNCKSSFEDYKVEYDCQNCEYGIEETTRDIDFDGTGYNKCHVCHGTGTESYIETNFCCSECHEEFEENQIILD